ncbi:MAG TPA: hypothetical protein VFG76_09975 [Candidatus Polarisedimenticolia bacterium]|nr:hypothetical protein [Candidatus Polarisedimenticolia bacterium]
MRLRTFCLLLLTGASLGVCLPARAASTTLTVDEIIALLKGGVGEKVILMKLASAQAPPILTVDALLALKSAGASDALLETLLQPPASPASVDAPDGKMVPTTRVEEPSFRIYQELNAAGETVLHITNLDASGRRLGGESPTATQANVIQEPPASRARAEERFDEYEDEAGDSPGAGGREAPVIVNVYNEQPQGDPYAGGPSYPPYQPALYPSGLYPGYPGILGGYSRGHRHGAGCGHLQRGLTGYASPPGSYTHFLLYHQQDEFHTGPHLRSFDVTPYTYGNAASRNRATFRRP